MKGLLIKINATDEGVSIEEKIRKAKAENAPIEAISPEIYTPKKDGVRPEFDPRTDRQEIALDAIDHYQASEQFKTDEAVYDKANGEETTEPGEPGNTKPE